MTIKNTLSGIVFFLVVFLFSASQAGAQTRAVRTPAQWSIIADSAKWFYFNSDLSQILDSTAGQARLNVTNYDTTFTIHVDSSGTLRLVIWYPGDTKVYDIDFAPKIIPYTEMQAFIDSVEVLNAILDARESWPLAGRVLIGDTTQGVDEVYSEVVNLNGWSPPDSFIVDMSIFNATLDDDTTLVDFLRAGIGGSGSSITAAEIMDSLFNRLVSDTVSGTYFATLIRLVTLAGDTALFANPEDIWTNLDTNATIDTSAIGVWMVNNLLGAGGTDTWSAAQRDTALNRLQVLIDSAYTQAAEDIYSYFISGSNEDVFKAVVTGLSTYSPTSDSVLIANRGEIAKQNADSTWTRSSRTLSSLGFVLDSLGFSESYWHKIANRSDSGNVGSTSITAADIAMIADTLFNRLVSDTVTGTYLSTLLSLSASGGSGGATATEIMDSLFNRMVSDTTTGTFLSELYRSLINVRDSIFVYDTRFDSLLNAIADANKPNFMATTTGLLSTLDISTIASQTADSVLEDSSAYQGSASGLTAEEIASTVNDTLTAQHPGNWAATGSSGSGAYTFTVTVVDTGATADSVVPGAMVFVNNVDQDMTPYQVITDNNGEATFNLDAGTWVKFTTEPGFPSVLDTFAVSATGADSLFVYRDAGTMTTVAFQIDKPNSYPYASAKISIDLVSVNDSSLLWVNDTVLAAASYQDLEVMTSNNGLASINLHANSSISNDSTYYKVLIRDNRSRRIIDQFRFNVPVSDTTVWIQYLTRW